MCCPRIGGKICLKTRPCSCWKGKSWQIHSLLRCSQQNQPFLWFWVPLSCAILAHPAASQSATGHFLSAPHWLVLPRFTQKIEQSLGNWSSRWMVGQMEIYSVYNYINNYKQKDYQSRLAVYNNHHPFNFIVQYLKTNSRWQGPKHGHGQKNQLPMGPCQGWYISEWASRPAANAVAPPSGSGVTRNIEDAAVIILSSQYHCGHNFHQPSCHINISISILVWIAYRIISYEYHIYIYISILI